MNLVIVESPTKARTLGRFLGKEYIVAASMGHVRDLPSNKMNIDVGKDFEPYYELSEGKGKVVKELQDGAAKAKMIYLAMDPDREGEAIAYHVKHVLTSGKKQKAKNKSSNFKRITFHQITKSAVEEAIKKAGTIDMKMVEAQQARRVLDRLAGYSLSPVLWRKVRRGLSAGRVQSVALRLLVEREAEIKAFKEKEFWEVGVLLKQQAPKKKENGQTTEVWVSLVEVGGESVVKGKGDDREFLLASKKIVEPVLSGLKKANYVVESVSKKERKRSAYPPYTTSTLQQAAANLMGWTAKRTMSVAQKLYEKGLITYHRTDSFHLAPEAVKEARGFIEEKYGVEFLPEKPNFYKTQSKSAQEAHEAIRPTSVNSESGTKADGAGGKLYGLIWKRFVASQMVPAVYDATTINVKASKRQSSKLADQFKLRASGSVMKFEGWKIAYGGRKTLRQSGSSRASRSAQAFGSEAQARRDDKADLKSVSTLSNKNEEDVELPEVTEGEDLAYKDLSSEHKFTQPPPRFNDASLVKTLESLGIGRPSTYAPTISTLMSRGYVERVERRFYPTPVGITVTEFLKNNFKEIMDYGFTAEMENDLDKIADGKRAWVPVIREFWAPFNKKVKEVSEKSKRVQVPVEKTGKKCPTCGRKEGGEVVIRSGRFGKFLSCSRFPDCRYTGKIENKIRGIRCEKCKTGNVVIKKTRKGRTFYGCSRYPNCDWASWTDPRQKTKDKSGGKKKTKKKA